MRRRSLLTLPALALLPAGLAAIGQQAAVPLTKVVAGDNREGKRRSIGLSETTYKVLTSDTGGNLFVMEQLNRQKGGPSRHLHHYEDELFFCLEGRYVVEVGEHRSVLMAGDCVLGPRGIAHAWAVCRGRGRATADPVRSGGEDGGVFRRSRAARHKAGSVWQHEGRCCVAA